MADVVENTITHAAIQPAAYGNTDWDGRNQQRRDRQCLSRKYFNFEIERDFCDIDHEKIDAQCTNKSLSCQTMW